MDTCERLRAAIEENAALEGLRAPSWHERTETIRGAPHLVVGVTFADGRPRPVEFALMAEVTATGAEYARRFILRGLHRCGTLRAAERVRAHGEFAALREVA
jgi:hypothetical protein